MVTAVNLNLDNDVGKSKYPILRMTGSKGRNQRRISYHEPRPLENIKNDGQNTEILEDTLPDGELSIILSAKVNTTKFNDFSTLMYKK